MCSLRFTGLRRNRCYLFWEILSTEALWPQGQMLDTLLVSTLCIGHLSGPVDTFAGHCQRQQRPMDRAAPRRRCQSYSALFTENPRLRPTSSLDPDLCIPISLPTGFWSHTFVYIWLPRECFSVTSFGAILPVWVLLSSCLYVGTYRCMYVVIIAISNILNIYPMLRLLDLSDILIATLCTSLPSLQQLCK